VHWRETHPHALVDALAYDAASDELRLGGYLRGRWLSASQLAHVTGIGTFAMRQIKGVEPSAEPLPPEVKARKPRKGAEVDMSSGGTHGGAGAAHVLSRANPALVPSLDIENAEDPLAGEQTWPTEEVRRCCCCCCCRRRCRCRRR